MMVFKGMLFLMVDEEAMLEVRKQMEKTECTEEEERELEGGKKARLYTI